MTHLPITITAYFFNALSLLANKFLLSQTIKNPVTYVFYISLMSLLILPAIFFVPRIDLPTLALASFATILWTMGAYLMFKALSTGLVSRVVPTIGALIPLMLLIAASYNQAIRPIQIQAVLILVLGTVLLTLVDLKGAFDKNELFLEIGSAFCFALSYLYLREAYLKLDFFAVLVWSRLILIPGILAFLVLPKLRKIVFANQSSPAKIFSKTSLLFLAGQTSGTVSELLLLYAISLANPALVNSLSGTQYIFLFIFTLILSKKYPKIFTEKYSLPLLISKFLGIGLIFFGLYLLV